MRAAASARADDGAAQLAGPVRGLRVRHLREHLDQHHEPLPRRVRVPHAAVLGDAHDARRGAALDRCTVHKTTALHAAAFGGHAAAVATLLRLGAPTDALSSDGYTLSVCRKTGAKPLTGDSEPLAITVKADGNIFLQDTAIEASNLVAKLRASSDTGYEERIYVRGDKAVAYGDVADVVACINAAGFSKVALVTDLKSGQGKK